MSINVRILEEPDEMIAVEDLQQKVWPDSDLDIIPLHLLITFAKHGGLVLGAFDEQEMVGFVFGFLGIHRTPEKEILKHYSHQLGVLPGYRDQGVGFALKRAQWQLVRHQNIELITWTFDPLQSRNANLNISKLGGICNTYKKNLYGTMRDGLNAGVPSDRFQVELWVNSARVQKRLSKRPRGKLSLPKYFQAGAELLNPTNIMEGGLPYPSKSKKPFPWIGDPQKKRAMLLVEIPADYQSLRAQDESLALQWRIHTRDLFVSLFEHGYLVTDVVFLPGAHPRSFYVLSHGERTLGA